MTLKNHCAFRRYSIDQKAKQFFSWRQLLNPRIKEKNQLLLMSVPLFTFLCFSAGFPKNYGLKPMWNQFVKDQNSWKISCNEGRNRVYKLKLQHSQRNKKKFEPLMCFFFLLFFTQVHLKAAKQLHFLKFIVNVTDRNVT